MKNVVLETISIKEINSLINSFSKSKIEILTQPAIQIKNLDLSIPVYTQESRSLTKSVTKKIVNMTGGDLRQSKVGTSILALNNINLKIMKGERVALIGHNGSGKSSFLRLISGIYMPTNGTITVSVDVYPMLQKTFLTSNELSGLDACKAHFLLNMSALKVVRIIIIKKGMHSKFIIFQLASIIKTPADKLPVA